MVRYELPDPELPDPVLGLLAQEAYLYMLLVALLLVLTLLAVDGTTQSPDIIVGWNKST